MKKIISIISILLAFNHIATAQFRVENNRPLIELGKQTILCAPEEGLWSVSTFWENDWPTEWRHSNPSTIEKAGEWTILKGEIELPEGKMLLRDSYRQHNHLIQCIRRFEWTGRKPLHNATLSVRFQMKGKQMQALLPGILYYGNKNGAKVNPNIIPVYEGMPGEFAIFEDHRYPMPFAMLENKDEKVSAAIHTLPSPVRGAVLSDQWWSMGVEAFYGYSELVLLSGPIGYNKKRGVAKALQQTPMKYTDTYLTIEPGRVIEKEFFLEVYPTEKEGSGFQQPIYTSLDLHQPYDANRFESFSKIVADKYRYAKTRWLNENNAVGFDMYDPSQRKEIVMGWCGQADSPGFAFQWLQNIVDDPEINEMVQQSLDFLTTYPLKEDGMFTIGYKLPNQQFFQSDHVSCGQAMYNFAKAIETGRKNPKLNTKKWEEFLKKICDGQSKRILRADWNPHSTAEAFYIAPLAIASQLFKNNEYKEAAIKAGNLFAERHLTMNGCYWGGTLDATCEDKEGSWAAFQGFLELYERFKTPHYLTWAKHAMDVCLTYVVVWDIPLPAGRMADYNFKSTGWTVVSPQNQHIDVYGVLFAPEVYKMGNYLKDERLKKLSSVMFRSCYQLTDPYGSQGEQLQQTNFAQHGDMSNVHKLRGGYSEKWTVFWITAHFLNAAARYLEMKVRP